MRRLSHLAQALGWVPKIFSFISLCCFAYITSMFIGLTGLFGKQSAEKFKLEKFDFKIRCRTNLYRFVLSWYSVGTSELEIALST